MERLFSRLLRQLPQEGGKEAKFADDLSVHKTYAADVPNDKVLEDLHLCQESVHQWGQQNRVVFDASKEEFAVLHHVHGEGCDFRLLGPVFDAKLQMHSAVQKVLGKARPKLYALLKTRRFYNTADLVLQYKTHLLCVLEACTPAVYHAATSVLEPLDNLQGSFLRQLGLTPEEAFLLHNLAPLTLRRDVAMLGLLHKCNLGVAHDQLRALFPPAPLQPRPVHHTRSAGKRHSRQLLERCTGNFLETTRRSAFGLVRVYNLLPQEVVDCASVRTFQTALTSLAREACKTGRDNWETLLSPRKVLQG